jgi:putative nucleotidyltransferase with HDIG domain
MTDIAITIENRLKKIQNYITHMPSLSTTSTKVMEICNNPAASPSDLNRVIALDPVLTGQVMKLINSAYYSLPNKITSLTRAIIMLGLNTVKNLVLGASIIGKLGGRKAFKTLSMDAFWEHSLGVGVTAKMLASQKGLPVSEREEYFVAGLLHDLGKIPLNNRFPEDYAQVLKKANENQIPVVRSEEVLIGIDHSIVGAMIADRWQFTGIMKEALRHHHQPENASPENQGLVKVVALANIFINIFEIGSSGNHAVDYHLKGCMQKDCGLEDLDLSNLREVVLEEIEKAKVFLEISSKG